VRVAWDADLRTAQYVAIDTDVFDPAPAGRPTGGAAADPEADGLTLAGAVSAAGREDASARGRLTRVGAALRGVPGVAAVAVPVRFDVLQEPPPEPTPVPPVEPTPTPAPTPAPPAPVAAPNDPYWNRQWGEEAIGARDAWALTDGRAEIVVAVLDTGVDLGHPDLKGRLIPGTDIGSGDSNPSDENGHGTHVAGIVAAASGNARGVSGTAPHVVVMPVKVASDNGSIWDVAVAKGMDWAIARGARVINLSLGGDNSSPTVNAAIDRARSRGVVVVAAAGNDGGPVSQPAAYSPALAVAAVADQGPDFGAPGAAARYLRASYSNTGPEVDLAAPGTGILSTIPTRAGSYATVSGTSMATPFVSAAAALLFSRNPSLTAAEVETALVGNALDLGPAGPDPETGAGLLRVGAAAWSVTPPASDGGAPAVQIGGIADGTLVRGKRTLAVSATDPSPIVALRLYRDGTYLLVRRSASFSMGWNSSSVRDGLHTWVARATDAGLDQGAVKVRVLVANDRAVTSIRASRLMTATVRRLSRDVTLARTGPFVARTSGPAGSALRLRLLSSTGRVVAEVDGTGSAAIAISSLRAGRYSLRASVAAATVVPGRNLRLSADWFR
jgi:subtilisin family serine protease